MNRNNGLSKTNPAAEKKASNKRLSVTAAQDGPLGGSITFR
jgi:hypothetical protein